MSINVDYANTSKTYKSFEEAAQANKKTNSEIEAAEFNGKIFKSYKYNGSELLIEASDKFLKIYQENGATKWEVSTTALPMEDSHIEDKTTFNLNSGEKIFWDWKKKFDDFLGKQFAISASDSDLFIFWRGGEENIISFLRDSSTGDHYLIVTEV